MIKIKKIMDNDIKIYNSIKEAAASVQSDLEPWKVQMCIAASIINKKRAFKAKWIKI